MTHTVTYIQVYANTLMCAYVLMEPRISHFLLDLLSDSALLLQWGPQKVRLFSVEIFRLM